MRKDQEKQRFMWIVQIVNLDISKNELVQCVSAAQCKCEISGLLFNFAKFQYKDLYKAMFCLHQSAENSTNE